MIPDLGDGNSQLSFAAFKVEKYFNMLFKNSPTPPL